ncbi:uncharacterized protein LOC126617464 isoform X4 [Malus sylvestris]|uniref:uncharacterized protein LOC126617464 isoform X4 n=1 Tax=Malus sylvestris TaxID=3752 RepID=UPI0021ABB6ED|nr:uncharacterized protein LOC126617464 isoform X4 [Malus sylvestris]
MFQFCRSITCFLRYTSNFFRWFVYVCTNLCCFCRYIFNFLNSLLSQYDVGFLGGLLWRHTLFLLYEMLHCSLRRQQCAVMWLHCG